LPKTGGASAASLFALGAGVLLVGGGLLARRIVK
jgi:LPXTG-motif cell wall-anchored protein